jgi:hypothetical protein
MLMLFFCNLHVNAAAKEQGGGTQERWWLPHDRMLLGRLVELLLCNTNAFVIARVRSAARSR